MLKKHKNKNRHGPTQDGTVERHMGKQGYKHSEDQASHMTYMTNLHLQI